jgi:3-oxoacyl-[acyl-carrier protein] reductase
VDLGLARRRALVTGSYRGTGAGIARVLAREGAEVIVHGGEPGQGADVVAGIVAEGGAASLATGDLASDAAVGEMIAAVGPIDVLVNNSGAPSGSTWESMERWAEEWDRNMLAGVRTAQAVLPTMRTSGWGRIVFVGTVGTRMPSTRSPGYYGAKAGLHAICRSLAQELRGSGVTCNLISPGMIATDEVKASLTRRAERDGEGASWEQAQRWALRTAMPNLTERIPEPEDIGRVVALVVSDAAWHINGAEIAVDGGTLDARS